MTQRQIVGADSWYALKVFYNRVAHVANQLSENGIETFVPMESKVVVGADGRKSVVTQPLVNSLMFFRAANDVVVGVLRTLSGKAMAYMRLDNPHEPAPIADSEMEIFKLVTGNADVPLQYLGAETERYCVGERVRVTQGPLVGAEGHICRIRGDKRLVVTIDGVCAVATSYIPAGMLEKIE